MGKNRKKSNRRIDRISLCFLVIGAAFFGVLFWLQQYSSVLDTGFNSETAKAVEGEFRVTYGAKSITTPLPGSVDGKAGEQITITGILPQEESYYNSLIFYVQQSQVRAYLEGELMIESEREPKLPFQMPPSSRWYFFRLPEDYVGKELRIEIIPTFDEYARELPEIFLGTKASFLYMIMTNAAVPLLIGLPMVVLGIVLLLIGITLKERDVSQKLTRLGLVAILISIWILMESQITQIFMGNLYVGGYVLFSCYYLIPVALMSFLLTYPSIKKKKGMRRMFWVTAGAYGVVQFLQLTGISYFIQMVWVVHILIVLIIFGIVSCYVSMKKEGEAEEDPSIYRALFILGVFALGDIFLYYVNPAGDTGRCTMLGIVVFLCYLGYTAVRRATEMQKRKLKEDIYRELAFKDIMTGLENRSAFETEQERMRNSDKSKRMLVLMADVNDLKGINDKYGHSAGDDAIISTAKALKESFNRECRCFRIGGDEFCVITETLTELEFEEMYTQFEKRLEAAGREKEYSFRVACGYRETENNNLEECMEQADQLMYERKARMKDKKI